MGELSPNAFETFSSAATGHENQLTRALLVLLRLSPMAHQAWLRQIRLADLGFEELGEPIIAFQTSRVPGIEDGGEAVRGISVFITREEPYNRGPVEPSDRSQIPDALITYPEQERPIVVVVESKVGGSADESQAREINLGSIEATWTPPDPVELRWASLIDELWALINLDLVSGAERRLLLDFFDYVDHDFREVGPFRTLRRCGGVRERELRRFRTLLAEATGLTAREPRGDMGPYVEIDGAPASLAKRAYLDPNQDPNQLRLSLWPADTSGQARALYCDPATCERLLALGREDDWRLVPNMHFGHIRRGLAWVEMPAELSVDDYIRFWRDNTDLLGLVYRPDWDSMLGRLQEAGVMAARSEFDADFTETGRNQADVRPGLQLYREWSRSEAVELDESSSLLDQVRESYETGLSAIAGSPASR